MWIQKNSPVGVSRRVAPPPSEDNNACQPPPWNPLGSRRGRLTLSLGFSSFQSSVLWLVGVPTGQPIKWLLLEFNSQSQKRFVWARGTTFQSKWSPIKTSPDLKHLFHNHQWQIRAKWKLTFGFVASDWLTVITPAVRNIHSPHSGDTLDVSTRWCDSL